MFKKLVLTISVLAAAALAAFAQTQVSGTVTDPSGAPLPGVYVYIEGTNVGTVTDAQGAYALSVREGDLRRKADDQRPEGGRCHRT